MKILLLVFAMLFAINVQADFTGICTSVHDGDTITVEGKSVRLYGIDSPELSQTSGTECKKAAEFYVLNKEIFIKEMGTDKYGRTIGLVILDKFTSSALNSAMLRYGYAWHYKEYSKEENFAEWERLAQNEKRGIWREKQTPPWEYRKEKKRLADAFSSRLAAKDWAESSVYSEYPETVKGNKSFGRKSKQSQQAKQSYSSGIVYIAMKNTGTKYHRMNCRTCKFGAYPVQTSIAIQNGYAPCKVCGP